MTLRRSAVIRFAIAALAAPWALRVSAADEQNPPKRKPDLGDAAEGTYAGDVISDSKGSSQSGVTLTVTRISKNLVRVTSDYPRLPVVEVPLTLAMGKILQARGDSVFLLDRSQAPAKLDVSFHNEVSWSGFRR
ncbi:MAG TPA: hypothetical protein VGM81_01960 [Burkholderiaceae bacterium]